MRTAKTVEVTTFVYTRAMTLAKAQCGSRRNVACVLSVLSQLTCCVRCYSVHAVCEHMDLDFVVPVCPPEPVPPIADFLVRAGWPGDAGPVKIAALWLRSHGINCERDFTGLGTLQSLCNAEEVSQKALDFLQSLVSDADDMHSIVLPVVAVPRPAPIHASTPAHLCDISHKLSDSDVTGSIFSAPSVPLEISSAKPLDALKRLRAFVENDGRENWVKKARVAAILGNCPKSRESLLSGTAVHACTFRGGNCFVPQAFRIG